MFITNTDLNTQTEWNCSMLYIFKVTFGINLAIIMCLCFLINAMFLHSLTIKWLHQDVISSLFNESFDFLNSTQYSNKLNSITGEVRKKKKYLFTFNLISRIFFRNWQTYRSRIELCLSNLSSCVQNKLA